MRHEREYMGREPSLPGEPTSVWLAGNAETGLPPLTEETTADVAVVGAGLTGVLTAVLLAGAGRSVVLLERRRACGNATGHTTAKATIHHGPLYTRLHDTVGELGALHYAVANLRGLNLIQELCDRVGCGFQRVPSYVYVESPSQRAGMRREASVMTAMGLQAAYVEAAEVPFPLAGAVRLENQGIFDPVHLVVELLRRRPPQLQVFEETAVTDVDDGEPCVVTTEHGKVRADEVVIASQFPVVDTGAFFTRLIPHTSMAIAVRVRNAMPDATFYCDDPEHGVRTYTDKDGPLIIVSGEQHPSGADEDDRVWYRRLEDWTRDHFDVDRVLYHWSTEDFDSPDALPYVGRAPFSRHLLMATGFGGWGMTNAAGAALMLSSLIAGQEVPEAETFDPSRRPASGAGELVGYLGTTASAFTAGWLGGPGLRDPEALQPGEGAVLRHGGHVYAAQRDDGGELTLLQPACRHLGCPVTWNEAEKTWDCPCHGSRYASDGFPLYAPTRQPLRPAAR